MYEFCPFQVELCPSPIWLCIYLPNLSKCYREWGPGILNSVVPYLVLTSARAQKEICAQESDQAKEFITSWVLDSKPFVNSRALGVLC